MELFVLRHGQAEAMAPRDQDRELTAHGREEVRLSIERNLTQLLDVEKLWVSPYVRAQQTAAIAAECLPRAELETTELLTPEAELSQLCRLLENSADQSVMLVSHQPLVGTLVNWLCGLAPGRYNMSTATLACIDAELLLADLGELRWLRHPGE